MEDEAEREDPGGERGAVLSPGVGWCCRVIGTSAMSRALDALPDDVVEWKRSSAYRMENQVL